MILTVTPNAALDHTVYVEKLVPGAIHRGLREHIQAGGKGINVARILHTMGIPVRACVVVGGANGRAIVRDLQASGIDCIAVPAPGESRTCLEIIEAETGHATQLHGAGVDASAEVGKALVASVREQLPTATHVAVCGSLPPGLPDDTVARIVDDARRCEQWVAVDTSGPALKRAWSQGPDLIRVNADEVEEIAGSRADLDSLGAATTVVVSDGAEPVRVRCRTRDLQWVAEPPSISLRNSIGCGDAMLASLLRSATNGIAIEDAIPEAVALAAADAESEVAGQPNLERGASLVREVRIRSV